MVREMVPEQQIPFSWQPGEIKLSEELWGRPAIWISKTWVHVGDGEWLTEEMCGNK